MLRSPIIQAPPQMFARKQFCLCYNEGENARKGALLLIVINKGEGGEKEAKEKTFPDKLEIK